VIRLLAIVCVLFPAFATGASGHDVSQSESKIEVHGRDVTVSLRLNLLELPYVDLNGDGFISYDELDHSIDRIYADIKQHYTLRAPALPTQITLRHYGVVEDHVLQMDLLFKFDTDVTQLEVDSTLFQLAPTGNQHLLSVDMDGVVHEGILNAGNQRTIFTTDAHAYLHTIESFVLLGIEHIFTGYDHLAFLVGLLIVTTNLGNLIKIITSFTVAHSITLALSTFNIVVLPSRLTESLIPLTIGYVAVENLLRTRVVERYYIAFVFGLIHGFGFSNVLREMQLSRSHLAISLFSFNAGVEVGQLSFVLVLFPLILYIGRSEWKLQTRVAVSVVIICLATYWFARRAFLI
jgi:hypothetical protein